jgi:glycosyltransferase involved in cell wall biosynthesis
VRIGLVTRLFPPAVREGSQLSVYHLARGLAAHGHEVHVITTRADLQRAGGDGQDGWPSFPFQIHEPFANPRPEAHWDMDLSAWRMGWQLREYLNHHELSFDILHAYGMDTIPAVVRSRTFGRPVGSFSGHWATCPFWDHTDPSGRDWNDRCTYRHIGACVFERADEQQGPLRKLARWQLLAASRRWRLHTARRLDLCLPISEAVRRLLLANGFPEDRLVVCQSRVDPAEYMLLDTTFLHRRFSIPSERHIFLYAGRLVPSKGCETIVEALPAILAQHPNVHLVFAGQGSELGALRALAAAHELTDHVTFGGVIVPQQMPQAYASAFAAVHSATLPEPFARAPLEALAAGTAVIATNTGGTSELITDGETGLLVPPFDADALATACIRLLDNPMLRDPLIEQGHHLAVQHFSIDAQIPRYLEAYERLL